VENLGNTKLDGIAEIQIDGTKVSELRFVVPVGEKSVVEGSWDIDAELGEHKIGAVLYVDGIKLGETQPKAFEVEERPAPPVQFDFKWWHGVLIVILIFVLIFLYSRRDAIRDHLWRRQFGKSLKH
jgi:hypothetical protein